LNIEAFVVTLFPMAFLAVLFGGGELFRRRQIDMDGDAPIDKSVFYASKYLIVVVWMAMVLDSWGIDLSFPYNAPAPLKRAALLIWAVGFALLFIGRFGLGSSFRIGSPRESTELRVDGLFRFSRNPMYLGVYATLLAGVLCTLNPVVLLAGIFVVAVHHRIVLAEEQYLQGAFGEEYANYCHRVRRYL
jgi:protein-S-isoprenylcysteine O-methyltransferase Ste14